MEFTLLWAALTAVAFGKLGTRLWSDRLPDRPTDRLIGAAAVGLITGRLASMVTQGINPIANPLDIIIVRGGVHTGAATIGALVGFLWVGKWRLAELDAIAPSALFALAGWHVGCLWRGACLGSSSDLPWAWSGPGSMITRHPVELYTALGLTAAAWLIAALPWRFLMKAASALLAAGLIRWATEPLRPSITGGPTAWYLTAMGLGLGLILLGPFLEVRFSRRST